MFTLPAAGALDPMPPPDPGMGETDGMADETTAAPTDLSPDAAALLTAEENADVIADLRQRILMGDMGNLEEAEEYLLEALEDADEDATPADEVVRHLWTECHHLAQQWEDEQTDVDRLMDAFEHLVDQDISCGLFTDWASLELTDEDKGGVLVWVNAWEDLSHEEPRDLIIGYTGTGASDEEVGDALVAALRAQGLEPQEPVDSSVRVPVLWRWPVDDPADLEGDELEDLDDFEDEEGLEESETL